MSLSKVMDYCYRCVETDGCYKCTIIDYVKEKMRNERISDPGHCSILHDGKRECNCLDFCSNNDNLHYDLL